MNDQAAHMMPVVVELPAEIDVTNSGQIYDQLVAALAPGVHIVVADLTATSFCDSSRVRALMHAYEGADACGIQLRLAVTGEGSVRRVLQLTGVERVMPVYLDLKEALHAD